MRIFGVMLVLTLGGLLGLGSVGPSLVENISNQQVRRAVFALSQSSQAAKTKGAESALEMRRCFDRGLLILSVHLLRWGQISVAGTYRVSENELLASSGLAGHPYFWRMSLPEIQRGVSALGWIKSVDVSWKLFPLRLALKVEEHDPWLIAEYEGHSWILSRSLSLVAPLDSIVDSELVMELSELPRLSGLQNTAGVASYLSSSNARLRHAAQTISLLELAGAWPFAVERYDLLDDGSLKMTPKEMQHFPQAFVAISNLEEAQLIKARFSTVLSDLESRREKPSEVDLRFKNQAVIR